ncbi:MAG TPA: M23 family metallopeptidase [Longimicrobium sp.]|jgi:murein DD-endopeptidase MepM/ murein hydrolase activator NlpD|uniref:M23 family metallopeptidase n=1 Tax=Longimicrobium sp. TaxID=2029185 RepID=UPI002EDB6A50
MSTARALGAALTFAVLAGCRDATGPPEDDSLFTAPIVGAPMADLFYGAYLDHDPGGGARDHACGLKAYDGHTGVDILLRNFQVQDNGVPVIAAADGTVTWVRDGLPDRNTTWEGTSGFGNAVEITHPGGLSTIYGHLRRGSVAVSHGESVRRGAVLGLVGSSGRSNWPHLHFEVRKDGGPLDPFAGECSPTKGLWADQLAYQDAFKVTDAGIADHPLTYAMLLERPPTVNAFPLNAEGMRFWLQVANQPAGQTRFELRAPGGTLRDAGQAQVGASFSMRYLLVDVPVNGYLVEPGAWQIRTYQGSKLIHTQPFTLLPVGAAVAGEGPATPSLRGTFPSAVRVFDQPPGAGAHP